MFLDVVTKCIFKKRFLTFFAAFMTSLQMQFSQSPDKIFQYFGQILKILKYLFPDKIFQYFGQILKSPPGCLREDVNHTGLHFCPLFCSLLATPGKYNTQQLANTIHNTWKGFRDAFLTVLWTFSQIGGSPPSLFQFGPPRGTFDLFLCSLSWSVVCLGEFINNHLMLENINTLGENPK